MTDREPLDRARAANPLPGGMDRTSDHIRGREAMFEDITMNAPTVTTSRRSSFARPRLLRFGAIAGALAVGAAALVAVVSWIGGTPQSAYAAVTEAVEATEEVGIGRVVSRANYDIDDESGAASFSMVTDVIVDADGDYESTSFAERTGPATGALLPDLPEISRTVDGQRWKLLENGDWLIIDGPQTQSLFPPEEILGTQNLSEANLAEFDLVEMLDAFLEPAAVIATERADGTTVYSGEADPRYFSNGHYAGDSFVDVPFTAVSTEMTVVVSDGLVVGQEFWVEDFIEVGATSKPMTFGGSFDFEPLDPSIDIFAPPLAVQVTEDEAAGPPPAVDIPEPEVAAASEALFEVIRRRGLVFCELGGRTFPFPSADLIGIADCLAAEGETAAAEALLAMAGISE